jgi:hypothetical protein
MATRMQQRRGTAAQWISTNSGNGPILAAGEIGYESDTNKFKIGDGTNHWLSLDYFMDADSTTNPQFGSSIVFEGATANGFETTLSVTDPTADRAIILPDAAGTVVLANSSTGAVTISGDLTVSGTTTTINSTTINATTGLVFEGSTADAYETTIRVVDPTADREIEFPNVNGTVVTTGNLSATGATSAELGYLAGVTSAIQTQLNTKQPIVADVSDTEISYLNGVTSAIQTQLNNKQALVANITDTEIGYLDGVTSAIQTQLNNKQALVANITDTEIGYLDGVTSAIQTQLDAKATLAAPTFTGTVVLPSTTSIGDVSSTEIGYVNGVTSGIQVQLDAKSGTGHNHLLSAGATDVTATAAEVNKLAGLATTAVELGHVTGVTSAIQTQINAKSPSADPTFTGTVTLPGTTSIGDVSSTEIGYVNGVTSAIQTQLDAKAALSGATFTGAVSGTSLTLSGDLTVNGTTTTINSTELSVDDKNIVLGDVATPSDATADGGGITLKGATDKTFNWVDATDSWTSSENINLASGKDLKVNGTAVISSTAGGFIFTDGTQTKAGVPSLTTTFSKTASYNLSTDGLSLRDGIIEINAAGETTLTIPANSTTAFPVGTSIDILQTGAGTVTIAGAVGVTLNSTPGQRLRDQWSSATLLKRAENTWVAMGDLKV